MIEMAWDGVFPAITTPFTSAYAVDHEQLAKHATWLVEHGARAIVPLGSLGEGATLSFDEKCAVLETLLGAVGERVPIVPGIAALSTAEAMALAARSAELGCSGLMVLPPYVYKGFWRETKAHFSAVIEETELPCMLYNNPHAYGTDVRPELIVELVEEHPRLVAVKESTGDVRRVTAIRALLGDRVALFVGLDDAIVEGVQAGAVGWVAGLVNALPAESHGLFDAVVNGDSALADVLYRWFLPLLRLDTVPHFVQLIKLVQAEVGMGDERVRPPRLVIEGPDRARALTLIRKALADRPAVG